VFVQGILPESGALPIAVSSLSAADDRPNIDRVTQLVASSLWSGARFSSFGGLCLQAVRVRDGGDPDARALLDAAKGVYGTEIRGLRIALATSFAIMAWLAIQRIDLSSIVAAEVAADGSLRLYTD
jgi:hypothetical protein